MSEINLEEKEHSQHDVRYDPIHHDQNADRAQKFDHADGVSDASDNSDNTDNTDSESRSDADSDESDESDESDAEDSKDDQRQNSATFPQKTSGFRRKFIILRDFQKDTTQVKSSSIVGIMGNGVLNRARLAAIFIHQTFPRQIPRWAAFCSRSQSQDFWAARFGSSQSVFSLRNRSWFTCLQNIINQQEAKMKAICALRRFMSAEKARQQFQLGIVLDGDVIKGLDEFQRDYICNMISNGRHFGLTIILTFRRAKQITPGISDNMDYLVMSHCSKESSLLLSDRHGIAVQHGADLHTLTEEIRKRGPNNSEALILSPADTDSNQIDDLCSVFRQDICVDPNTIMLGSCKLARVHESEIYTNRGTQQLVLIVLETCSL